MDIHSPHSMLPILPDWSGSAVMLIIAAVLLVILSRRD